MNNLSELGRAVAQLRLKRGMTQVELAAHAGVASSSLSRFEAGRAGEFGARKLLRILEILGQEVRLVESGAAQPFTLDEALAARNTATEAPGTSVRKRVRHSKGVL